MQTLTEKIFKLSPPSGLFDRTVIVNIFPETGVTVSQYINTKRINEACYLLMHTSASIADISLQAGYPDSGYFSRVFHKIKRMTPTEWRNKEKNF